MSRQFGTEAGSAGSMGASVDESVVDLRGEEEEGKGAVDESEEEGKGDILTNEEGACRRGVSELDDSELISGAEERLVVVSGGASSVRLETEPLRERVGVAEPEPAS
jgi:hypothetical protein